MVHYIYGLGYIYKVATFCKSASVSPVIYLRQIRLERWFGTNRWLRQWFVTVENNCHCIKSNGCLFKIHCHSIDTNSSFLSIKTIGSKGSFSYHWKQLPFHRCQCISRQTIDHSSAKNFTIIHRSNFIGPS